MIKMREWSRDNRKLDFEQLLYTASPSNLTENRVLQTLRLRWTKWGYDALVSEYQLNILIHIHERRLQ